ncbi:hypothetical protein [Curtobacterium ammoniigenes]|uniref:hypothetical protein n=1 Tax=Curtobacterium ammoniigenes TaxID=395387 RepID=UPI00146FE4CF|nr:hypothetical protein [Curtobacterium ammoniigenes]
MGDDQATVRTPAPAVTEAAAGAALSVAMVPLVGTAEATSVAIHAARADAPTDRATVTVARMLQAVATAGPIRRDATEQRDAATSAHGEIDPPNPADGPAVHESSNVGAQTTMAGHRGRAKVEAIGSRAGTIAREMGRSVASIGRNGRAVTRAERVQEMPAARVDSVTNTAAWSAVAGSAEAAAATMADTQQTAATVIGPVPTVEALTDRVQTGVTVTGRVPTVARATATGPTAATGTVGAKTVVPREIVTSSGRSGTVMNRALPRTAAVAAAGLDLIDVTESVRSDHTGRGQASRTAGGLVRPLRPVEVDSVIRPVAVGAESVAPTTAAAVGSETDPVALGRASAKARGTSTSTATPLGRARFVLVTTIQRFPRPSKPATSTGALVRN